MWFFGALPKEEHGEFYALGKPSGTRAEPCVADAAPASWLRRQAPSPSVPFILHSKGLES